MGSTVAIFSLVASALCALGWAAVANVRRAELVCAGVVLAVVLTTVGAVESTGWHRPHWSDWRLEEDGSYRVLAVKAVDGEAIYAYLDVGAREPRPLVFPWDEDAARELLRLMRRSRDTGRGLVYSHSFTYDSETAFSLTPPPPAGPMKTQDPPAEHFDRGD